MQMSRLQVVLSCQNNANEKQKLVHIQLIESEKCYAPRVPSTCVVLNSNNKNSNNITVALFQNFCTTTRIMIARNCDIIKTAKPLSAEDEKQQIVYKWKLMYQ